MRFEPQPARTPRRDYSQWSIEELRGLASQMRVAGARSKSRRELIDLFAVPSPQRRTGRSVDSVLDDKELS